ncbi:MAG: putative modification methylase [Candidatus Jettenia ecosi]|uniref:Putative modification methylase n=1 Tax=Candidatus Jettenia ecosi TaxID=2494326 RepID=A0A533Q6J0_9BACT|nr:MAG: putative modification methylase [Candidatus Jettenia ecosi]
MTLKLKESLLSVIEQVSYLGGLFPEASISDGATLYGAPDTLGSLSELADERAVLLALKKVEWSFQNDKTSYLSHDIHPYPAKFIPQIPRNLITRLSLRGEVVWDPFGGSGTTALETILLGRRAISSDVNPLSEIIGRAKTLTMTKEEEDNVENLIAELAILSNDPISIRETLNRHRMSFSVYVPLIPNIEKWFHRNAIEELAYLRWRIESLDCKKTKTLAKASFSKSILKASFQDEETRYARRSREVEEGEVISLFAGNLASALKKVRSLSSLLQFREANFKTLDLREGIVGLADNAIAQNSIDLIVASPPYPNCNDYHLYHRFRLFWLGYDPRDFGKREIGSHLRHQRETTAFSSYLDEMTLALKNMKQALRPGRYAALVLGDAVFHGEIYETASDVAKLAEKIGFEYVGTVQRTVHKTKRSFVAPGRRARSEDLLILRKPVEQTKISLLSPPYKLWQYEILLRKKEIETLLDCRLCDDKSGNFTACLSALSIDKIRRLTFTHGFYSPDLHRDSTWQAVLENGDAFITKSRRKDPRYVTHGIHEYKGKFYPQLAKSLFNLAGLQHEQTVLDPFCGSGTVLLESYLNGLKCVGFDMNPLAVKISRAKLSILEVDPYLRDRLLAKFQERLDYMESDIKWISAFSNNLHDEILSWFPKLVIGKLGWLLKEISYIPDARVREFLEVVVSSVVRQVSQQDPRDLRIRRRAEPIKDAPVRELFEERLKEQRKRLHHFAERCNRSPYRFNKSVAMLGDSREIANFKRGGLLPSSVDAVVTSPPYATALPYIDTDRLSILLFFGFESNKRSVLEESITGSREIKKKAKSEIDEKIDSEDWGVIASPTARKLVTEIRRRNLNSDGGFRKQNMAALLYRYFLDMSVVIANLNAVMQPDASAFFVIGDTRTEAGDKVIAIKSGQVLAETGEILGWDLVDTIPITVTTEDRPHSKNSITENDIVWFKKKAT